MGRSLAVIGVGNMAKSIIAGILKSNVDISTLWLHDKNKDTFKSLEHSDKFVFASCICDAVKNSDCVLLSVKPQNYPEVLQNVKLADPLGEKLYVSIAAGITSTSISKYLNGAKVIRVLPNLPMTIGFGVSAICRNCSIPDADMAFVQSIFASAGSTLFIEENEMNRVIGVLSSSPAYVFEFIDAICKGADAQGLNGKKFSDAVCDVVIGSAELLKKSGESPSKLISKVASKGGTTQRAIDCLESCDFYGIIAKAMIACTERADELGKQ